MTMSKTDAFDVVLKSSVQIKKSDGKYTFVTACGMMPVKNEYQPILKTLYSGAFSSEALLAALTASGASEVSANLTLAQFLVDCVPYID